MRECHVYPAAWPLFSAPLRDHVPRAAEPGKCGLSALWLLLLAVGTEPLWPSPLPGRQRNRPTEKSQPAKARYACCESRLACFSQPACLLSTPLLNHAQYVVDHLTSFRDVVLQVGHRPLTASLILASDRIPSRLSFDPLPPSFAPAHHHPTALKWPWPIHPNPQQGLIAQ